MTSWLCLGLVSVWLAHGALASFSACDKETRVCAGAEAHCVRGKCACKQNYAGVPHLGCVPKGHKYCTLISDPRGHTFGLQPDKGIDLPLPCEFFLTRITAERKSGPSSTCTAKVSVAEQRVEGKFYVSAFHVTVEYTAAKQGATRSGSYSFRATGEGEDNQYKYTLMSRPSLSGTWSTQTHPAVTEMNRDLFGNHEFHVMNNENRITLSLAGCGLHIFFRPADSKKKVMDQTQMPGILVAVNDEDFDVTYRDMGQAFCLTPDIESLEVADIAGSLNLNNDEAFLFRAAAANFPQSFDFLPESCTALGQTASRCTDVDQRSEAMQMCSFILLNPKFVYCFSKDSQQKNSGDLVKLFGMCLEGFCHFKSNECSTVQQSIKDKGCGSSELTNIGFMGFACSKLGPLASK